MWNATLSCILREPQVLLGIKTTIHQICTYRTVLFSRGGQTGSKVGMWQARGRGARGAGTGIVAEAADSTPLLLQQGEERVCLPCLAPACFVCPACLGAFTAPSVTAIQISIAHSDTPVEQEYKILNPENAVPQYSSHTGACCIPVCWAELQATLSQQPAQPTITSLAWLGIKCVGYCVPRLACNLNRLRCIRSAQTSTVPQQPVDPHLAC